MGLHRLCRSDNMGVRDLSPHLPLRLGNHQEWYGFVKCYATIGQGRDYDWGCELTLTRRQKRRCPGIYGSVHSSIRRLESCRGRRFD